MALDPAWVAFVQRWERLPEGERKAEWDALSADQRRYFLDTQQQLAAQPPQVAAQPLQVAPRTKRPAWHYLAGGCGCLGLGFLALSLFVIIPNPVANRLEERGRTAREKNEAAQAAEQSRADESLPVVQAWELIASYETNEISADRTFKGKVFLVQGRVSTVGKDLMDNMYVSLEGNDDTFRQVQCFFADDQEDELTEIGQGSWVTLRGKVDQLMGNVHLSDCRVMRR